MIVMLIIIIIIIIIIVIVIAVVNYYKQILIMVYVSPLSSQGARCTVMWCCAAVCVRQPLVR